jgi:putative membrane protein
MRAAKLNKEQQQHLTAALSDAEKRTAARLALTVVRVSDKYALYPMVYGAALGLAAVTVLAALMPSLPIWIGAGVAVGGYLLGSALLEWLPLRLALIPKHAKLWECWELAHRSFASKVLAQNERKIGILLFVSLGERYVEVVTDRDVDLHVPQSVWDAVIKDFIAAAKKNRIGDGLIAAVESCTKVLETHYPKT